MQTLADESSDGGIKKAFQSHRKETRFFRKLLKGLQVVLFAIVTDRLASYAAVLPL